MGPGEERKHRQPKTIMATVYLKSQSGRSLLGAQRPITGDPAAYQAAPATVQRAIAELQQRGFTIEAQGITLSISGTPELFERVFGISIWAEENQEPGSGLTRAPTRLVLRSSQPVMYLRELEDVIEGVVLAIPATPFGGRTIS